MNKRGLFFDVNGVFLTYEDAIKSFLQEFNAKYERDYSYEDYVFFRGVPPLSGNAVLLPLMIEHSKDELMGRLNKEKVEEAEREAEILIEGLPKDIGDISNELYHKMFVKHIKAKGSKPLFKPNHVEIFDDLYKQHVLGIITNDDPYFVRKNLPFIDKFSVLVSSHHIDVKKPHPEIYKTALEKSGLSSETIIYVCDGAHDVEGGVKAGFETYAIYSGMGRKEWLYQKGAKRVFNDLDEYLRFLSSLL